MIDAIDIPNILKQISANINILKMFFIIICTYYTNFRITNMPIRFNGKFVNKLICIISIAIICGFLRHEFNYLISWFLAILSISIIFSKDNIYNAILTTLTSFGINYIMYICAVLISFAVCVTFKINNNYIKLIIIVLLYLLSMYRLFKTKKLKYGIAFLQKRKENEYIDILVLNVSLMVLVITTMIVNSNVVLVMQLIASLIVCIIIMFITIQKSLQLYYKQKLLQKDLDETKEKLAKKEKEVEELEAENIEISKKSHTLTHKQKSLEHKIEQIAMKAEISTEEAAELRERIKEISKDMYKEKTTTELSKTEIPQIDNMLEYMQTECKKNKIDFELQISGNIHYMTNNLIPKEDLETLLADHIKNAIIAINHTDNVNRSILVRLGEIDGIYSLYIYDSGIEFQKETLENLGKKPSTTHKDEGGTGMGFMNTFDTLRKHNASLTIEEIGEPSKDNYTKAIIIKFEKNNQFKIISYR